MAEEFLLLCFDDQTGKKIISSDKIEPALGGALLIELALKERIGVTAESAGWRQRGRFTITDTTPTDEADLAYRMIPAARSSPPAGSADAQPIAIRIGNLEVSSPRIVLGRYAQARGELLRIPDAQVDQGVRPGVASVFAQEEGDVAALDRGESRQVRFEAMDIDQLESESLIPSCGRGSVSDPQYWNHFFPRC